MPKIRVLIVDDSVVIRRLLTEIVGQDPDIEVAGTAPNGRIALQKLTQVSPDIVTLDIEMPILNGLETLSELRKTHPRLPVIMFSTLTERGAAATLEALDLGATDYVTKPANVGSVGAAMDSVRSQMIPKIKSLCRFSQTTSGAAHSPGTPTRPALLRPASVKPQRRDIVVIGSSTGGPRALSAVIGKLPADFPVPIVVVQHMPKLFTRHLADRLNQECELEVLEAAGGETLQPGQVLIAPGDFHLELRRYGVATRTVLNEEPAENSCRPAVDVLFRSAAALFGAGCQAVILTGMGKDGLRGAEQIVQAGGSVVAQDEASSVVWGMPRAVVEAGLASRVVSLESIAEELVRCVSVARRAALLRERIV